MSSAKMDALSALNLSKEIRRVVRFYQDFEQTDETGLGANRNQLQESTGMSTQAASGRTSDAEKLGIIYKTGHRRGRQSCLRYESDPKKWSRRAADYRNLRKHSLAKGFLDEFGVEMPKALREDFARFGSQTSII